uniref:Uncharacterized protein n=1 Tax=Sipha flava TaxID=143950 RepID=A0A2S2Q4E8_9HEMI
MVPRSTPSGQQCSVFTVTAALVLIVAVTLSCAPSGAGASAIRPPPSSVSVAGGPDGPAARFRRDAPAAVDASPGRTVVRRKRTLLKLKPLVVLPAKLALGAGSKLVAGAKLGAKAVGVGAKALGVGAVGLKAVKKVTKVTIKAATALGVKAVLLNFLFQKINQVIDFKTRLLSNLDQRNKQKNAQFLSPVLSSKPSSGSVGNKDDAADFHVVPPPPQGFVEAADSPGFATAAPPLGFVPGSDLIASPPPSPSSPQGFNPGPQGFNDGPPGFNAELQGFSAGPPGFAPQSFAAPNDDGSPSSDPSY